MSGEVGYGAEYIEAFMRGLKARTAFIVPDPEFDARLASNERLVALGLPPRVDNPRMMRMWEMFFADKLSFLGAESLSIARGTWPLGVRAMQRHTPEALTAPAGRQLTSLNWAGATVVPSHGRRFTDVYGVWKVPAVTVPPGGGTQEYFSSIFIGLDGQRRYFDASLPQIGTRQDIIATGPRYETWFEWFALGQDNWPTTLGVQVAPGENVMAWMTVLDATHVRMMIRNLDRPSQTCAFTLEAPSGVSIGGGRQPRVSAATAEWIFERPTSKAGVLEELPAFAEVAFLDCLAVADGATAGAKVHSLTGASFARMLARRNAPHRTALVARPDVPAGLALRVRSA